MKKFTIKHALGLALAIVVMLTTSAIAYTSGNNSLNDDVSNERILVEQKSNIAYNNINNSFVLSDNVIAYDNNYAGAYLNDDGRLVVLITSSNGTESEQKLSGINNTNILSFELQIGTKSFDNKSADFRTASTKIRDLAKLEEPNNISFQEAKYSYKYLTELMDQLNDSCQKNCSNPNSIWSEITSFAILDDKNCISIEIRNISDTKIKKFLVEVNDSDAICFSNSIDDIEQQTIDITPVSNV